MASPQPQPVAGRRRRSESQFETDLRRAFWRTIWLRLRFKLMELLESSSGFDAE